MFNYLETTDPTDPADKQYNRGVMYSEQGNHDCAIEEYLKVFTIMTGHVKAHHNLGVEYCFKEQHDRAILEFQEAIRIKHDLASAHYNLGFIFHKKGEIELSISEMRLAAKYGFSQANDWLHDNGIDS